MCAYVGPKNFGDAWPPLDQGVADHLQTRHSPMCYHAEFGSSRSNCMNVGRVPKIWMTLRPRPFAWGVADPQKHAPPLHVLPYTKFGYSRSNGIQRFAGKMGPGLSVSRSLKVTGTDMDQ